MAALAVHIRQPGAVRAAMMSLEAPAERLEDIGFDAITVLGNDEQPSSVIDAPAVRRHIVRVPRAHLAISAVTEAELQYGVAHRPDATRWRKVVDEFLLRVTTLPWTRKRLSNMAASARSWSGRATHWETST